MFTKFKQDLDETVNFSKEDFFKNSDNNYDKYGFINQYKSILSKTIVEKLNELKNNILTFFPKDKIIDIIRKLNNVYFEEPLIKKLIEKNNLKDDTLSNLILNTYNINSKKMDKKMLEIDIYGLRNTLETELSQLHFYNITKKQKIKKSLEKVQEIIVLYEETSNVKKYRDEYQKFKRMKCLVDNIKKWYDEIFVKEYFNPLLEKDGFQKIDEKHKYNFYYVYLLLLVNTYKKSYDSKDALICIDEFQDLSKIELQLLQELNGEVKLNLYGDFNQRLLSKGIIDLNGLPENFHNFNLNNNYRNTNQITKFYNNKLNKKDQPVGSEGPEVNTIFMDEINNQVLPDVTCAFICNSENYSTLAEQYKNLNVIKVEDTKGLEFNTVYVYDKNMNDNEKYIAYSRALYKLLIVKDSKLRK